MEALPSRLPRHLPLRTHLLLLVAGTLVPMLMLSGVLLRRLIDDNRAAVERRLLETARAEAALVDRELSSTIRTLQGLAESARLDDGDLTRFRTESLRLQKTQPGWHGVILLDTSGRQLVNTGRTLGTTLPDAADPDSLRAVVQTRTPLIGNLRRGAPPEGVLAFPVRVPVIRDGALRYVLTAIITPEQLSAVLASRAREPDEVSRGIVDASGMLVARSRNPERYVGRGTSAAFVERVRVSREGVYRTTTLDGEDAYSAYIPTSVAPWSVGVAVSVAAVEGAFLRSLSILMGLGLLLLGAGTSAAFLISRRVSRDIGEVKLAAEALASGRSQPMRQESIVSEVHDLSRALESSAQLLRRNEHERDEHLRRAEQARSNAEAADRAKDEFLAMLGHEMRNPLAPVVTALQLMRMRGEGGRREREVIERQVKHLARLVDDLLDVSRLRRGKIELRCERFELASAVERAVEIAQPLIAERGHQLLVDVPFEGIEIDGDETRVAQIVNNLLTNAAKYTEHPGRVELCARVAGGHVVIECKDDGVGIGPDLMPRVFDLFAQGERSLDRRQGGLGLGLAVSRTLTELHGGTITVASNPDGQGSVFTVTLPLAGAPTPATQSTMPEPDAAVPAIDRVLLVDDNKDALDMLRRALELAGFRVATADSGEDALVEAERFDPEVGVLDIGLPGMDGFELARRLRTRGRPGLKLIALTGYGQAKDIAAAHAAGFDAHLVKPVATDTLVNAIRAGVVPFKT